MHPDVQECCDSITTAGLVENVTIVKFRGKILLG